MIAADAADIAAWESALLRETPDLLLALDQHGVIRHAGPAARAMLGHDPVALADQRLLLLTHPEDVDSVQQALDGVRHAPHAIAVVEARLRHRDSSWRSVEAAFRALVGGPLRCAIVASLRDITTRRMVDEDRRYRETHDPLTGLLNRTAFTERLARVIEHHPERAPRDDETVAVLLLDLDRFSAINDSLGHECGDALLVGVAERLDSASPLSATIGCFGGDRFAVLLEGVATPADALAIAGRVLDALREAFTVRGQQVFATASAGIALVSGAAHTAESAVQHADAALRQAKAAGTGRIVRYEEGRVARSAARPAMESDLRRAVERNELWLVYQPCVDLRSGAIVGMEALVRWQHPRLGTVPPVEFIPIAEETGLIIEIGRWVLGEACRQARWWADRFVEVRSLQISVNVSAREYGHPDLLRHVAAALRDSGISPAMLKLEITESALMDDTEATIETLHALKRLGVKLALDDFGTGFSSLNHLRRFPVDTLKIDRSFVTELGHSHGSLAIVRSVIALAHALKMDVTAEGFETERQLARLRDAYCDTGQGYYFSKPLPPEEMTALLEHVLQ